MKKLTLGSLFDGSGGFPLAGMLCGIEPIWASEIAPFPIRVTTKRLPQVKHYGDISKLNGSELPPVDIITFGSPCQSVSQAGKRAGIKHIDHGSDITTRSGLFFEAIRIIKEMRCATNGKYPRYAVFENVPGIFSSSGGEDYQTVLEEFCSVKETDIHIPRPKKWERAGEILGKDYSFAWRFGICSAESNSMKSDNPHSGFYETETSRTIDTSSQSPAQIRAELQLLKTLKITMFALHPRVQKTLVRMYMKRKLHGLLIPEEYRPIQTKEEWRLSPCRGQ